MHAPLRWTKVLVAALVLGHSPVAFAAPSAARTARALSISNTTLALNEGPYAATPELGEAQTRLEGRVAAWAGASSGLPRWFAGLALVPAERRLAAMLHDTSTHVSWCVGVELSAFDTEMLAGVSALPAPLREALWYRSILDPDSARVGELLRANPDLGRSLPPGAHAVLGRLVGAEHAGVDALAELRAALTDPDASPWTRLRYSELLRHRGEGALAQARLAAEAQEPCVSAHALRAIGVNRDAPLADRRLAAERAVALLTSLSAAHPEDQGLQSALTKAESLVHELSVEPSPQG